MSPTSDSISYSQIKVMCELLRTFQTREIEFVRPRYADHASDFPGIVSFFESLGLLSASESSIDTSTPFRRFLYSLDGIRERDPLIKEFILTSILHSHSPLSVDIDDFLREFHSDAGRFCFSPTTAQRLRYSNVRNLLMELDVVELDHDSEAYLLVDPRLITTDVWRKRSRSQPMDWTRLREEREKLGREAEMAVLSYERSRLKNSTIPLEMIEHVAEKDSTAGYDILSFEDHRDSAGKEIPRFIEVKAVSAIDYRFHWSHNEVDVSQRVADKYVLYLLPVKSSTSFYFELLKTIRDPSRALFGNNDWDWKEESFEFKLASTSLNKISDNKLHPNQQ